MEGLYAPWELFGEAMVARVHIPPHRVPLLPKSIHRIPLLPGVVIAERFSSSPVGEFLSLAVGIPARVGVRPGICFVLTAVSSENVRLAARNTWGFPTELANLEWGTFGRERELSWSERGISVRGIPATVPFPFLFGFRSLQRREDGSALSPFRMRAIARRAQIDIETDDDDPLVWVNGQHRGVYLGTSRVRIAPARTPLGIFSTLRAPLRARAPRLRPGEIQ
jgi:hypothetical protein